MWITARSVGATCLALYFISTSLTAGVNGIPSTITIGGLLSNSMEERVFRFAVNYVNQNDLIGHGITLDYIVNTAGYIDAFRNIQLACSYAESGVMAIIGPMSSTSVKAVAQVSAALHIPQISPVATDPRLGSKGRYPYLVRMVPPDDMQNLALLDLVAYFGWKRMAILTANTDYGVNGLVKFQSEAAIKGWVIHSVQRFQAVAAAADTDAVAELKAIQKTGARVVILHCHGLMAKEVLKQAESLGMTGPGWAWIVTDGTTTSSTLGTSMVPGLVGVAPLADAGRLYREFNYDWETLSILQGGIGSSLDASLALVADAVLTFANAAKAMYDDPANLNTVIASAVQCDQDTEAFWEHGQTMLQHIHGVRADGIASFIEFDLSAAPRRPVYSIVNSLPDGWMKVGQWNPQQKLLMSRPERITFLGGRKAVLDYVSTLANKTLRVATNEWTPLVTMLTDNYTRDNIRLEDVEGFTIDMVNMLADIAGFKYTLHFEKDGIYGVKDPVTGQWNGLINELITGTADFVPDLSITGTRSHDVDFLHPFLDVGLGFALKKPEEPPMRLFRFLDPFSVQLWMYIMVTMVTVGVAVSIINKISPYDYHGEMVYALNGNLENTNYSEWMRCKRKKEACLRTLDFSNSIFHSVSYLLSQGGDYYPKSLSGRVTTVLWWLAVVILTSTYTANLTAFLTVSRLQTTINTVEDLAGQTKISYGIVKGISTTEWFQQNKVTFFMEMNNYMITRQTMLSNNPEGFAKVRSSDYAFISDTATLAFAAQKPPCDLRVIQGHFGKVHWGGGVAKNSPYTEELTSAILQLHANGYINDLWNKWYQSDAGCPEESDAAADEIDDARIDYTQMLGVFYIIYAALALSLVVVAGEWVVKVVTVVDKADPYMPNTLTESIGRHVRMFKKDVVRGWLLRLPAIGCLQNVGWGKSASTDIHVRAECRRCGVVGHNTQQCTLCFACGTIHGNNPCPSYEAESTERAGISRITAAAAAAAADRGPEKLPLPAAKAGQAEDADGLPAAEENQSQLSNQYFAQGPAWYNNYLSLAGKNAASTAHAEMGIPDTLLSDEPDMTLY